MISAIEEIYNGDAGDTNVKTTDEYRRLMREMNGKNEEIMKKMSAKQRNLFDEILTLSNLLEAEAGFANFKYGFELGLSIGMEIALK
ncbi:MAG: hypothetical protein K2O89_06845 [Clostridia bacterium]|nr:hypothetical protein [Clostridia bacterium]